MVVLVVASLIGGTGWIYRTQAAQNPIGKEKVQLAVARFDDKGDKTPESQPRIAQLEKQLQALTSEVEALRKKLNAAPPERPAKTEVKMFHLQRRKVDEIAQTLWEMYKSKAGKEVRIGMDGPTNTLIIMESPNELEMLEAIITQLERLPTKGQNKDKAGNQ
jgi:type II secretory pathway component GspD/PulD (secretin)